jgi:hypothetical protein
LFSVLVDSSKDGIAFMNSQLSKRHVGFLKSGQLTTEMSLVAALIILMLSVAAHIFDFIGVLALADVSSPTFVSEAVVFGIVSGILALQICLLAIWCSLGGQREIFRIPLATTSLVLLINNWILAISAGRSSLDFDDVAIVFAGVFGVFILVQLPLVVIRIFYKFSIVPKCLISSRRLTSNFKIFDLFVLMFSAALLVLFTQVVIDIAIGNASIPFRNKAFSQVMEVIGTYLKVGVGVSLISLLALRVVFSKKYRWRIVVLLMLSVILIGVFGPAISTYLGNFKLLLAPVEMYQWFAFLNVVFLGEVLILTFFYLLGYRAPPKPDSGMVAPR